MSDPFINKMLNVWEKMKQRSSWHFDPSVISTEGKDSFTHVCRFSADFSRLADTLIEQAVFGEWKTKEDKLKNNRGNYGDVEVLSITDIELYPLIKNIVDYLGLDQAQVNFINEKPSKRILLHVDNLAVKFSDDEDTIKDYLQNPDKIRRFVVMLHNWNLGQVWQLGNANWYQWRAGECITWEWRDIPHSTCNMGWKDRPMLQITGITTEKTTSIMNNASKNLKVEINNG